LFVVQAAFPQIHSASSIGSGSAFDFVCGILIPTFSVCFYFVGYLDEVSEELEKSRHKLATLAPKRKVAGGPLIPAAILGLKVGCGNQGIGAKKVSE
jgi:amino acid transporter